MTTRGLITSMIAAVCTAGALVAPAVAAETLRVCADPDNLPFSKSEGPERGLYIELADMVARRLGMPVEYVWWLSFNQRKALRNTILDDGCDAYFALPYDADYKTRGLARTHAFMDVGYAVVAPPGSNFASLSDLKGKRVAVQFASTPQLVLSTREGYTMTTFRSAKLPYDQLFARLMKDHAIRCRPVSEQKLNAVRVSTHLFNSPAEIDALIAVTEKILRNA